MQADKSEAEVLHRALKEWQDTGMLTSEHAADLHASIVPRHTERQQIAQYFFFIALFCTLLAFGAIFINEKLLEKIKLYFAWNDFAIAAITAVLSILWFWYVGKKRSRLSPVVYEIYMVLGGLSVLTSLVYVCKEMGIYATYTTFLIFAFTLLILLSGFFRSRALWMGAIAAIVGWYGTFSTLQSTDNLFLGMNYPVRYTVFGIVVLAFAFFQRHIRQLSFAQRITYGSGMILFFTSLWCVSIFGNYSTLVGWQQVRQVHVLAYSLVFAAAAVGSFYIGIKYKDDLARDFGVLFVIINLYTRYFEYFWDTMNKGIFFSILAITFGLVGWLLERKRKPKAINIQ